jgi:hypothetical protein
MSSIFSRLNYNFDSTKFGTALDPTGDLVSKLNKSAPLMTKWQYDAVANSDISGYFQNPVGNVANSMHFTTNNFISISTGSSYDVATLLIPIEKHLSNLRNSIVSFTQHTNRLSGVTVSNNPTTPDLNSALGVGEIVLLITNKYDGIQNNVPILGNFTSLFTKEELDAELEILLADYNKFNRSINIIRIEGESGPYDSVTSNLTQGVLNNIVSNVISTTTQINNRVQADLNFYAQSKSIVDDYSKISQMSNFSPLKLYFINNYVGTEKLKSKL